MSATTSRTLHALVEVVGLEGDDKPVSAQTIIHRLNALNRLVQEWRLANQLPEQHLPGPITRGVRPPNGKGRHRRLNKGEEDALSAAVAASSRTWLSDAMTLAIETAMCQTELAHLTWDRVHLDDEHPYVHLPQTKNGRERNVPLSDRAIEVLTHLRTLAEDHNDRRLAGIEHSRTDNQRVAAMATPTWDKPLPVETGRGVIHAFRDAVEAYRESGGVGLDDLRWHDLRHEAVSRLFELTELRETENMAIIGHFGRDMLEHYATLRTKQFRDQLSTADGARGDPAGTVKLRPGKPALVKTTEGKWVRRATADDVLSAYARKMLKAAQADLTDDNQAHPA
jgi:integrase